MQRRTCVLISFATPLSAWAGPYSSGLNNTTVGATDAGIPGFVGSLGDGKSASPNTVNPAFADWASGVTSYLPVGTVDPAFSDPTAALGPVTGDNFDIVSLGENAGGAAGQITLAFKNGIRNGSGSDFAVFENALGSNSAVFADLAFVQVSSDGQHFAQFPATSLTPGAVGAYGTIDPTNVHNLAGKQINAYGNSWGTPFDLSELKSDALVTGGQLNLNAVRYVRLIDVVGDGATKDSAGNPIFDAFPTYGSGGFDLEAIGVLNGWQIGDANLDGKVDIVDLGVLSSNWQGAPRTFSQGDTNFDGKVDIVDLGTLSSNWQKTMPGVTLPPSDALAAVTSSPVTVIPPKKIAVRV